MNLIEAIALLAMIMILGLGGPPIANQQSIATQSQRELEALILHARALATTTTGGVSVSIQPSDQTGQGGTVVEIYAGRPESGVAEGQLLDRALTRAAITVNGSASAGIFFGANDHLALSPGWTPWTTIANEPGCPTEITFAIAGLDTTADTELSCDNATLN